MQQSFINKQNLLIASESSCKSSTYFFGSKYISHVLPLKVINLYSGGAEYGTGKITRIFQINSELQPEQMNGMMQLMRQERGIEEVKVSKYKTLTSLIIDGNVINKDKIIQYIANKKGGAHFDKMRKKLFQRK